MVRRTNGWQAVNGAVRTASNPQSRQNALNAMNVRNEQQVRNSQNARSAAYRQRTAPQSLSAEQYREREGGDAPLNGGYSPEAGRVLRRLSETDFALQELALYLDAYPNTPEALAEYRRLLTEREEEAAAYEALGGVLTNRDLAEDAGWNWVKNPWPWEYSFPGNSACGCSCGQNREEE